MVGPVAKLVQAHHCGLSHFSAVAAPAGVLVGDLEGEGVQLGGEVAARTLPATGVAVSVGAEAYRDLLVSTNLGDLTETRAALFGELAAGREGSAVAHVGLRGDHHSAYGGFIAPSVAAAAWVTPAVKLRASAARSFRAPNWTERYYIDPANEGDPDLEPETSWNAEVAAEARPRGGAASVSIGAYVRDARALIDWARPAAGDDDVWRTMNVGRAVFRGLELDARARDRTGTRWGAQVSLLGFSFGGVIGQEPRESFPEGEVAEQPGRQPAAAWEPTEFATFSFC
jgi:outer membrane receptor for ferrienterochelin and colicin